MATTAEKKDWLKSRAEEKADSHAALYGDMASRRASMAERKRINQEVRAEFKENFGISWIAMLTWLPTIWQIVSAIFNLRFGQASE